MADDRAIDHLEALREDIRDETKRRIEQRDKYSVQLTIALSALVALSLSTGLKKALIAAPLVSIYYTVLILYSYRVHSVLVSYLREQIEPELARRCGTPPEKEWETYYHGHAVPGIRRSFFLSALWVTWFLSALYLWVTGGGEPEFKAILVVSTAVYLGANMWITVYFLGDRETRRKLGRSQQ